jgi:hypothetical protein
MWLTSAKMFVNEKSPFPLRKFHSIANLCATLNAATTFIMFMIYGTKFRAEFTRIYSCCFNKLQRRKSEIIINKHEQQQVKQLIPNNDEQHIENQRNSSSDRKTRHSSNTTVLTSLGTFPSLKCFRNQQRKSQYTLDQQYNGFNSNKNTNQQQESTIREGECINLNNGTKLLTVPVSYDNWFRDLIYCR